MVLQYEYPVTFIVAMTVSTFPTSTSSATHSSIERHVVRNLEYQSNDDGFSIDIPISVTVIDC